MGDLENDDDCEVKVPVIIRGEDKTIDIRLVSQTTGDPFDVSAATEIMADLLNEDGTCLDLLKTTGGVQIVSGLGGHIRLIISAAQSALLKISAVNFYSDIELRITIGGKITIVQFPQSVQVVDKLFPNC